MWSRCQARKQNGTGEGGEESQEISGAEDHEEQKEQNLVGVAGNFITMAQAPPIVSVFCSSSQAKNLGFLWYSEP